MSVALVWFRNDLRLEDNPALAAAIAGGHAIVPVFIWSPEDEAPWQPGGASRWWLHQSLAHLQGQLSARGSQLILRRSNHLDRTFDAETALWQLIQDTGATAIYWNRRYEPAITARDTRIKRTLRERGLVVETFNAQLAFEPWEMQTQAEQPYRVFTPFWRACLRRLAERPPREVATIPFALPAPDNGAWPTSLKLDDLDLRPRVDWAKGLRAQWSPGEAGAHAQLARFIEDGVGGYAALRNTPAVEGTSRLSPHLHFGEIGPGQIWRALRAAASFRHDVDLSGSDAFLREVGWREFSHHLLFHFPATTEQPLRPEFARFPWRESPQDLLAWQRGQTGFPLVDAGMRELWQTGFMHNRVRMVVASFLVKHLMLPWQDGARWFWDTLVDADLAQNTLGWQWTAGCGADAAPYFRVFNPSLQGTTFDAGGAYVRRFVPELANVPNAFIHAPWRCPQATLHHSGVRLGDTYPHPMVDHAEARARALAAFSTLKTSGPAVTDPQTARS